MKSAQDIFNLAYSTSRLNEPGRIADETGELLALLNEKIRIFMAKGARMNQVLFAAQLSVDYDAPGWPRPDTAEMILRLEAGSDVLDGNGDPIAEGTEIVVLPYNQRHIEPGKPAVYEMGGVFYRAGREIDPGTGHITFMAAAAPEELDALEDPLPDVWPEAAGNPLLKWEIALYLALKDGERENEATAFAAERKDAEAAFLAFCESATVNVTQSYGHGNRFNSQKVSPR